MPGIIAVVIGIFGFTAFVINKVITGHGLDYYFTGFGYEFSYLGVLILIMLLPILALIIFIISWFSDSDQRDFIRKYVHKNGEKYFK